jgi:hypothetical protein
VVDLVAGAELAAQAGEVVAAVPLDLHGGVLLELPEPVLDERPLVGLEDGPGLLGPVERLEGEPQ